MDVSRGPAIRVLQRRWEQLRTGQQESRNDELRSFTGIEWSQLVIGLVNRYQVSNGFVISNSILLDLVRGSKFPAIWLPKLHILCDHSRRTELRSIPIEMYMYKV